jgi:acetylornithine deacetylase/succinyl-diaminopimelate desuccinylase family protein
MVNKKRLLHLIRDLIRINSENPPGDESRIARYVGEYLKGLGLKVSYYEFAKKRTNILAVLPGEDSKKSLLITPHLDTVPRGEGWKFPPFAGRIQKGKLYGLGATDCKSNLACSMEAMKSLVEEGKTLPYNLIFAATADEESGSELGLLPLLQKRILRPTQAVVLDADDFSIIVRQKGLMHVKVQVWGKRAHGAYPWLGVNAIDSAVAILSDIKKHGFSYEPDRYLRPPTVNIGTIRGGDKVNIVADWCEFELDFRFLPGMSDKKLLCFLRGVVSSHAKKFKIEVEGVQQPYTITEEHALVESLVCAMEGAGAKPVIKGSQGATTISFFQEEHIPAVATGFGSSGCAHVVNEYVRVANLYTGARALERFLLHYRIT